MPTESRTRMMARVIGVPREPGASRHYWRCEIAFGRGRRAGVPPDHGGTELGEFLLRQWSAGVMRGDPAVLGSEAERHRDVEVCECRHLAVEPGERIGAETVRPREAGAQMLDPEPLQPGDGLGQAMVLEVKPLADAEVGRMAGKVIERDLGRAVVAQQAHTEMPIVRGALGLLVPRGRPPGERQVVKAVPMDARRSPDEKLGGAFEAPRLHLFGAEAGDADLADPDWQVGHGADFIELGRPLVDLPQVPVDWEAVHRDGVDVIEHAF